MSATFELLENARVESRVRTQCSGWPGFMRILSPGLSSGEEMAKNLSLTLRMRYGMGKIDMTGRSLLSRFASLLC